MMPAPRIYLQTGPLITAFLILFAFHSGAATTNYLPFNLTAPSLARTASTILLLWDRAVSTENTSYEILADGKVIARTEKLSHIATGLEAGRNYHFAVRVCGPQGQTLTTSGAIEAVTEREGPILDVQQLGAQGDGRQDDTKVIQEAITACPPGGTVLIPAGEYRVSHLELKSDLTLHLAVGATLRFVGRDESCCKERTLELAGPDGPVSVGFGALLTGVRASNVKIVGAGTISGGGESWWPYHDQYRPKLLEVIAATNLFVQGITLEDPPMWNTHPIYVDNAVFAGVTFLKRSAQPGANGDGLNPDSCRNVLIVGCAFGNQDDSIAIKSGKLVEGRRQRPCEQITVRDCRFDRGLARGSHPLGIAIGSENCGAIRDVWIRDCEFNNVASLINIKANRDRRHAIVENVRVENCSYVNTAFPDEPWNRAPIALDLFYFNRHQEDPDTAAKHAEDAPFFRDIHIRNITITNLVGRAVYISGLPEKPLRNLTFTNVTIYAQTGFFARNVDGVILEKVAIQSDDGTDFKWGANVTNLCQISDRSSQPVGTNNYAREKQ